MPLAALLAAMLASCELVPNDNGNQTIGCHSKHINCQRFDYQSLTHFSDSLNAHIKRWQIRVYSDSLSQLHDNDLDESLRLTSLENYITAINKRPENTYKLIKQAEDEGYSAYDRFLMEQTFLSAIIDLAR